MVVVPENTEMVFDQRQHRMTVPLYYIDVENSVGCSEDSDGDGDG